MGFEETFGTQGGNLFLVSHHKAIPEFIVQVATTYYEAAYLARNGDIFLSKNARHKASSLQIRMTNVNESLWRLKSSDFESVYRSPATSIAVTGNGLFVFTKDGLVHGNVDKERINNLHARYSNMEVHVTTVASQYCIYWTGK
jgi:phosphopantetheine adenylyltransferase